MSDQRTVRVDGAYKVHRSISQREQVRPGCSVAVFQICAGLILPDRVDDEWVVACSCRDLLPLSPCYVAAAALACRLEEVYHFLAEKLPCLLEEQKQVQVPDQGHIRQ